MALRIANCSGFFGDRLSAAREMIDGGPIDVLTGDWLAEITMGVLASQRARNDDRGYAHTFVQQMDDVLIDCLDRGVRVVSNAGGLNPRSCAAAVRAIGLSAGRDVKVAVVEGDDVTELVNGRLAEGWPAPHLGTNESLTEIDAHLVVANAYLGGWGIAAALDRGADVVITGRVSDASVVVGAAAAHYGWARDAWDELAGAVVAGHIIECGPQTAGGNYPFFAELPDTTHLAFPIADVAEDGSATIYKHAGTGGAITCETVTAQLLYEIHGPRYLNPDVVARFDTIRLRQDASDRVHVSGTTGEPAPETLKAGLICEHGWTNSVTFLLTGRDIERKSAFAEEVLWSSISGGRDAFDETSVRLLRADREDPETLEEATALLTISVAGRDPDAVHSFSRRAVETLLAGYPGQALTSPPSGATRRRLFWPTLLPARDVVQSVTMDAVSWQVDVPESTTWAAAGRGRAGAQPATSTSGGRPGAATVRRPFGSVVGARSGDKGGDAVVGLWARLDETFTWLDGWWVEDHVRDLLPRSDRHRQLHLWRLPNLRAVGVTIPGYLGRGAAHNLALDPQAKGLGEYLRARHVDLPASLLDGP